MKFAAKSGEPFKVGDVEGHPSTAPSGLTSCDACYLVVRGRRPLNRSERSDRIYFVHSGAGRFVIGTKSFSVMQGDFVVVPKRADFEYSGTMELVEFTTPPFDGTGEVELETVSR